MQSTKPLELHKRRDFSEKLSATIDFIRMHARPFIKAILFISGPFILVGSVLMAEGYSKFMNVAALSDPGTAATFTDNIFGLTLPLISGMIFSFIAGTLLIATVYQYVVIYDEKKSADIAVSEVWSRVKTFIWKVLGSLVIWSVVFLLIYLGGIFVVVAIGGESVIAAVLLGALLAFFLIYIGVAFSLVFIIEAYEKKDIFSAFGRAFELIRGKWWSTFGLVVVSLIIQSFITYIFMIPWYITFFTGTLHAVEEGAVSEPSLLYQIANYTTMSIGFLASNTLYAFPLLAIAFQYFNLVEMKEARGLMNKIETFGHDDSSEEDEEHY